MPGTRDNILDLLDILKQQHMNYVLAVFEEDKDSKTRDNVSVYTSFPNQDLTRLCDALKDAKQVKEKKEKRKPFMEI